MDTKKIKNINVEDNNTELIIIGVIAKKFPTIPKKEGELFINEVKILLRDENNADEIKVIFHNPGIELINDIDEIKNDKEKVEIKGILKIEEVKAGHEYVLINKDNIIIKENDKLDIEEDSNLTSIFRNRYKIIKKIIDRLEIEKPEITLPDIYNYAEKEDISRVEVIKIIDKLKQEGIVFEPKREIYRKLL